MRELRAPARRYAQGARVRNTQIQVQRQDEMLHRLASRVKSVVLTRVSPRAYWNIMGRLRPVAAVTSRCTSLAASMDSGGADADLLDRLGLLGPGFVTMQIGSGLGRVERALAERVHFCFGADVSPSMVAKASVLTPSPNVQFVLTTGKDLRLWGDASLDLVYSFFVFQHIPRYQMMKYLEESVRVLKPGGRLAFQLMMDEYGRAPEPPARHPFALRYYQRNVVRQRLAESGLEAVTTFQMDGTPDGLAPQGDLFWVALRPA